MRLCICEICMFAHVGPNDSIKQIEHTIASFVVLDALRMRLTISCCFGIRYSRFHSNTTATRQSTTWFNHFRDRRERVSELRCSHAIRTRISLKYVERTQSAVHGQLTSCICVCVSTDLELCRLFLLLSCHLIRSIFSCESALWPLSLFHLFSLVAFHSFFSSAQLSFTFFAHAHFFYRLFCGPFPCSFFFLFPFSLKKHSLIATIQYSVWHSSVPHKWSIYFFLLLCSEKEYFVQSFSDLWRFVAQKKMSHFP